MITNEVQYRVTTAHLERFEQAAAQHGARSGKGTKLDRLELDAVRAQADDLRAGLTDFDQLRGGTLSTFDAASLEELSTVLVKARVARGWTQRQLRRSGWPNSRSSATKPMTTARPASPGCATSPTPSASPWPNTPS